MRRARGASVRLAQRVQVLMASPRATRVLAGSLAVAGVAEVSARAVIGRLDGESVLAVALLTLATTLPLAFLDPWGAAVAVCASSILLLAGFHLLSVASGLATLLVLYRIGRDPPQPRSAQLSGIALPLPFLLLALIGPSPISSETAVLTVVLATFAPLAYLGGLAIAARQEAEENRAAHQVIADTLIEHTAQSERARIARELHDVVAHHISMIAVQAEAARLTVPDLPPAGAQRLSAIGDAARDALVEMRRLLGVLREDTTADVADRHPQPGLDQVTDLVDEARDTSGRPTRLIFRGAPLALDPNVELVAYRIVQEALTNSRRHAPGAAVDVELSYDETALRLRVRDNGPGPPSVSPGGNGVTGMQERAAAVGGSVRTGQATGGGYLVEAVLPAKVEEPT